MQKPQQNGAAPAAGAAVANGAASSAPAAAGATTIEIRSSSTDSGTNSASASNVPGAAGGAQSEGLVAKVEEAVEEGVEMVGAGEM